MLFPNPIIYRHALFYYLIYQFFSEKYIINKKDQKYLFFNVISFKVYLSISITFLIQNIKINFYYYQFEMKLNKKKVDL